MDHDDVHVMGQPDKGGSEAGESDRQAQVHVRDMRGEEGRARGRRGGFVAATWKCRNRHG